MAETGFHKSRFHVYFFSPFSISVILIFLSCCDLLGDHLLFVLSLSSSLYLPLSPLHSPAHSLLRSFTGSCSLIADRWAQSVCAGAARLFLRNAALQRISFCSPLRDVPLIAAMFRENCTAYCTHCTVYCLLCLKIVCEAVCSEKYFKQ